MYAFQREISAALSELFCLNFHMGPVFIFSPFLDGMFKLNWIDESSLADLAKERLCEKIKQLILDQDVVIEHGYQNSVSVDTHPIQEQQLQEVQSSQTSNATGFKRKCIFLNIHNDPKHPKKNQLIIVNLLQKK
jgi:hypothetical protein